MPTASHKCQAEYGPLKLKQASAVLCAEPKELQNLVQFGVVCPDQGPAGWCQFCLEDLFRAKIALHLKRTLGASYQGLRLLLADSELRWPEIVERKPERLVITAAVEGDSVQVVLPFRKIAGEIEERLKRVDLYRDLPRGRKRSGWKQEFLAAVCKAAEELEDVSDQDIAQDIEEYRTKLRRV